MAYSPSPHPSPIMTMTGTMGPQHESPFTPTPPPIPLSKRDKRRSALSDKLNELTASFAQNRDGHYRQQLQALQIDMTLVMRADPYLENPLDDSGEDIANLVAASTGGASTGTLAGKCYAQFVDEINNAVEERDTDLTRLEVRSGAWSMAFIR